MRLPPPARLWQPAILAAVLFGAATATIFLTRRTELVAAVWPVDALAVAFVVRWTRTREEALVTLVLAAAAMIAANLVGGSAPVIALALPALNILEILVAIWAVRRFGGPLDGAVAFAVFLGVTVLLAPAATGAAAAALFAVHDHTPLSLHTLLRWFSATGLGMAIVGSFALTVRRPRKDETRASWLRFVLGQAVVVVGVGGVLFFPGLPALFLITPFLVVGALSHPELGGVTAITLTAVLAWLATMAGRGPAMFAEITGYAGIQIMQVLLAGMVFSVLPISALLRRLDRYARELDARRARAEELSALKTKLLAHVSHEIRSPLSGVTGLAELLRDGALGELTDAQRDTIAEILSSGAEVDQLARDLTDAVAIQAGAAQVKLAAVDAAEAMIQAVNIARFRMAQYGAEIQIVGGPAKLMAQADALRLRQILVNLLVNAAKYGGRPPVVRVSVAETRRGMVRFEVADNGPGVPLERRAGLFRDFDRLGAEKSDLEGWGLGLALSYQMARLQGGGLHVGDSDLGGALFFLELPVQSESAAAA